jgi:hypothetical protein
MTDDPDNITPFKVIDGDVDRGVTIDDAKAELVKLYRTGDRISYEQRRSELKRAGVFLGVTLAAIDATIKDEISKQLSGVDAKAVFGLTEVAVKHTKLWHDPDLGAYSTFEVDGHLEHHKVNSRGFARWLIKRYRDQPKRMEFCGHPIGEVDLPIYPKQSEVKEAIYQIELIASFEGEEKNPRVRLNYVDGALWLDLGRPDWQGVKITADGWELVQQLTAPVIRGEGNRPLPIPVPGGDIRELRQFVNIQQDDDFALFCGTLASLYNTFGDYVTVLFCGPAGSGKTTATRLMRRLVDPNKVETQQRATVRDLFHGDDHVVAFENVSKIDDALSDAICQLNTGTGYKERKFYAQLTQVQTTKHCPVLINGIPSDLVKREDLASRTVTFAFGILGDSVISRDAFWRRFEAAWPRLLGVILDGVVGALRARRQFNEDNDAAARVLLGGWKTRFVDYALFGEAACRAMGFPEGAFTQAYKDNQDRAFRYLAENNPVCVGIRALMVGRAQWHGYPEQLYQAILPLAPGLKDQVPNSSWLMREDNRRLCCLARAIPVLNKVYNMDVRMHQPLERGDNRNGIVISWEVPIGTHSATDNSAVDEEPSPATEKSPLECLPLGNSNEPQEEKPFVRRVFK